MNKNNHLGKHILGKDLGFVIKLVGLTFYKHQHFSKIKTLLN